MTKLSHYLRGFVLALVTFVTGPTYSASPSVVPELNRLLAKGGHRAVDRLLAAQPDRTWKLLLELETSCDRPALALGLRLLNTTNASMLEGYYFGLQVAMGQCPGVLLPVTPASRVGELCNISALTELTDDESRAELQLRLSALRPMPVSKSAKGLICVQTYQEEAQRMKRYDTP